MVEKEPFAAALGLAPPWRVARSEFDADAGRLDLFLDFPRGARFDCPEPSAPSGSAGARHRGQTWRHLDSFPYHAYLHARLPRVQCPQRGVRQVTVSWARPGSGFTLLFGAPRYDRRTNVKKYY